MKKLPAPIERVSYTLAEAAAACGVGLEFFEDEIAPHCRMVRLGKGSRVKRLVMKTELERVMAELTEAPIAEQIRSTKGIHV